MVRDENIIELVVIYTHRAGEGFNRSTRMVRIICQVSLCSTRLTNDEIIEAAHQS